MKIAVVVRQVPDLIEPLELADSGQMVDLDGATFLVNESDNHALEQALLLKDEVPGSSVAVVGLQFGEIDDTLYAAAAKGADRLVRIGYEGTNPPTARQAAAIYAESIKALGFDLVLVGASAYDELESSLAPLLALSLDLPYVGVIRGVKPAEAGRVTVFKEFPGAVMAQMAVKLPAVLGVLGADQPPRYVPVSRIRASMKSTVFEEADLAPVAVEPLVTIERLYPPEVGERAAMLDGSEEEVAAKIAAILVEKGVAK